MIKTIRDVYLSEFKDMTFRQRHYYVMHNEYNIRWSYFKLPRNPLRWCGIDLLNLLWLPVLLLIIYPLLVAPLSLLRAKELKTLYNDRIGGAWFKSKCKVLDVDVGSK